MKTSNILTNLSLDSWGLVLVLQTDRNLVSFHITAAANEKFWSRLFSWMFPNWEWVYVVSQSTHFKAPWWNWHFVSFGECHTTVMNINPRSVKVYFSEGANLKQNSLHHNVKGWLWLRGRASVLLSVRLLVWFPWSACQSVLGQDTECQIAPDVLVSCITMICFKKVA